MRTAVLLLLVAAPAVADNSLPADGELYEGYCPLTDKLYGPLSAEQTHLLPRWLRSHTQGDVTEVVIEPEAKVRWRIQRGPHGTVEKVVTVAGAPFLTSRFSYDAAGRLVEKIASGPGLPKPLQYRYTTDDQARILSRTGEGEHFTVRWLAATTAETERKTDKFSRIDRWQDGRLISSRFRHITLTYERDNNGRLQRVTRRRGKHPPVAATFAAPDPTLVSEDVDALQAADERWEALLALGAPTHRREEHGSNQDWFAPDKDCWLNQISGLYSDATGRITNGSVGCVCGFCVAENMRIEGDDVRVRDEHFTAGPWFRLDGELVVTGDHRLVTPRGNIRAADLHVGDMLIGATGLPRRLRSIERLPDSMRRGVNLRTSSSRFRAAGFLLESETGECPLH
jgi:YD repeat-containing protein